MQTKWLKKNWLRLIVGAVIVGFFFSVLSSIRSCDDAAYKKDIAALDDEIADLKGKNVVLEEEAITYVTDAEANQIRVEELKAVVADSKLKIEELERQELEIEVEVMELPALRIVEETKENLGCSEILLNEEGVLFSVECARLGLLKLKRFSLVEKKYDEAIFALSQSEEALHFSERRSWNLYGALWKLGDVVLNLRVIVKKQDIKFMKSEKQRKKGFLKGVLIGVAIGGGITVTFVIIIPAIKAIF